MELGKLLVYVICFWSMLEAFHGMRSFKRPMGFERLYGWFGLSIKFIELLAGFCFDALKLQSYIGRRSHAVESTSPSAPVANARTSGNVQAQSNTSQQVVWITDDILAKTFRIGEVLLFSSMALFFAGEYNLRMVSHFMKTLSVTSLIGMAIFHRTYPPAVDFISTIFYPLSMGVLMVVSSISENTHLFWAVAYTVFFDKFSDHVPVINLGASYNSAVVLNLFVKALWNVVDESEYELLIPTTNTFTDIFIFPPVERLRQNLIDAGLY